MFPADGPMAVLFAAFLVSFVLVGLAPAWLRTMRRLRAFRFPFEKPHAVGTGAASPGKKQEPFGGYEYIVLRQLTRAGRRRPSVRQLADRLLVGRAAVEQALQSLLARGLVEFSRPCLIERRFYLSLRGRDFVAAQGFDPGCRPSGEDPALQVHPSETRVPRGESPGSRIGWLRGRTGTRVKSSGRK